MIVDVAKDGGSGTRADAVYQRLRNEISTARLAPEQRLKFPDLCRQYGTSVSVVREALTRLAAEGLVLMQPHQGYSVVPLSAAELIDLTNARVELESLTFRQSITFGDDQWESQLVAAHHLLQLREREVEANGRDDPWYLAHEAFHAALVAGCGNRRLVTITQNLRAETEIYRRWAAPFLDEVGRDPAAEHQALADAALARDAERGAQLLRDHIAYTTQMVLKHLPKLEARSNAQHPVDGAQQSRFQLSASRGDVGGG